jgi:hypothetical protein
MRAPQRSPQATPLFRHTIACDEPIARRQRGDRHMMRRSLRRVFLR